MPRAIATVLKMLKENRSKKIYQTFLKFNQVLGLSLDEEEIPKEIKLLAQERWQAKKDRDFAKADSLRVKLTELGYQIKDTREGFEISKI